MNPRESSQEPPSFLRRDAAERIDVVLVSMPFGPLLEPSLGLSLLKSTLEFNGYSTRILYLTFPFADIVGYDVYSQIAAGAPYGTALAGEWIFSDALAEVAHPRSWRYVDDILNGGLDPYPPLVTGREPTSERFVESLLTTRDQVAPFLAQTAERVVDLGAPIVGFTSVFQQQLASLALASRLKTIAPNLTVVFGGANCEGPMGVELVRQFPFVDAAVSGEGEGVIVPLVKKILSSDSLSGLPGVYTPNSIHCMSLRNGAPMDANAPQIRSLDDLPFPRFDDFFEQLNDTDLSGHPKTRLLFEAARGCWWGEKHHCTFCGLNGAGMAFRSKSAARVEAELFHIAQTYPGHEISFVDNILDMHYFHDLLPKLAQSAVSFDLFFEVKANLKRDQVRLLRDAGVTQIQPGIESLSTKVLQQMRKGVTQLQNIQLLKWCKEFGIRPHWNILWGFPGEDPAEYRLMAKRMPSLRHIPPPTGGALIRLDRFSPNFMNNEKFGFTHVAPVPAYEYIYPQVSKDALTNLAYFFSFEYARPQPVSDYVRPVAMEIERWQAEYEQSDLFYVDKADQLIVGDLRPGAVDPVTILGEVHRAVLLACDTARSARRVVDMLRTGDVEVDLGQVEDALYDLADRNLVISEDGRWLSLGILLGEYSPTPTVVRRFLEIVQSLGTVSGGSTILSMPAVRGSG